MVASTVTKNATATAQVEVARQAQSDTQAAEHRDDIPLDVVDAIPAGGAALLRSVPGMGWDGLPFALGAVGWIVLGGIVLLSYRAAERRVSRHRIGPVEVKFGDGIEDVDQPQFRIQLLKNVPESGTLPGSYGEPLTDLLGVNEATKSLKGVAEAIAKLLTPRAPNGSSQPTRTRAGKAVAPKTSDASDAGADGKASSQLEAKSSMATPPSTARADPPTPTAVPSIHDHERARRSPGHTGCHSVRSDRRHFADRS